MASSSLVTSIGTVTVETVPGLWALTTMFTVIRQAPKIKNNVHFHFFFSSLTIVLRKKGKILEKYNVKEAIKVIGKDANVSKRKLR